MIHHLLLLILQCACSFAILKIEENPADNSKANVKRQVPHVPAPITSIQDILEQHIGRTYHGKIPYTFPRYAVHEYTPREQDDILVNNKETLKKARILDDFQKSNANPQVRETVVGSPYGFYDRRFLDYLRSIGALLTIGDNRGVPKSLETVYSGKKTSDVGISPSLQTANPLHYMYLTNVPNYRVGSNAYALSQQQQAYALDTLKYFAMLQMWNNLHQNLHSIAAPTRGGQYIYPYNSAK